METNKFFAILLPLLAIITVAIATNFFSGRKPTKKQIRLGAVIAVCGIAVMLMIIIVI